jgi:hypothetical protein
LGHPYPEGYSNSLGRMSYRKESFVDKIDLAIQEAICKLYMH